jgi:hypothetical protein
MDAQHSSLKDHESFERAQARLAGETPALPAASGLILFVVHVFSAPLSLLQFSMRL